MDVRPINQNEQKIPLDKSMKKNSLQNYSST